MNYEDAKTLTPGDVVTFERGGAVVSEKVTGHVHIFRPPRGRVVFVPVQGELVVHTRIVDVQRG